MAKAKWVKDIRHSAPNFKPSDLIVRSETAFIFASFIFPSFCHFLLSESAVQQPISRCTERRRIQSAEKQRPQNTSRIDYASARIGRRGRHMAHERHHLQSRRR